MDDNKEINDIEENTEESSVAPQEDQTAQTEESSGGSAPEAEQDEDIDDFDDFENSRTEEARQEVDSSEEAQEESTEGEIPAEEEKEEPQQKEEDKPDIKAIIKEKAAKLPWKKIGIGAAIAAALFAAVYFTGVAYYSGHFYRNTSLGSFACSNMTPGDAEAKIREELENYSFTLYERDDRQEVIYGKDIDLVCESIEGIEQAKANQNPYGWLTDRSALNQDIKITVSFDEDKLWHIAEGLDCTAQSIMDMDGATAGVYYEGGTYHMNEVEDKNVISFMRLYTALRSGIYGTYRNMSLEDEGVYVLMADEDHLRQAISQMDQYVAANITYVKGDQSYVVNGDMINAWVQLNPDYTVTLDDQQIKDYVAVLAGEYNTIGTWREFKASSGNIITVGGGDYGWQVDQNKEAEALKNNILAGETVEREPVYYKKAFEGFRGSSDMPSTYVEVSIGAQHMWYYKDGALVVSSDCVTGIPNAERMTHTGVYYVKYKERNATLKGANYESKVSYWMPFNGGEGLHDAPWRGAFGGSIYKSSGSHGCVNLPVGVAATLFSNISAGTPVIVY